MIGRISSGDNRSILKIQKVVECCQRVLPLFLNYVKMFYLPQKRFVKFLKDSQNFHVIYRINVIRIHLCKKNCSCGCNNVQKIHKLHELCVLIANKHTCSHNVESRTKVVKTHEKKGDFFYFFAIPQYGSHKLFWKIISARIFIGVLLRILTSQDSSADVLPKKQK